MSAARQTVMGLRDRVEIRRCDADNVLDEIHDWCEERGYWGLNIRVQTCFALPRRVDVEIDPIEDEGKMLHAKGETLAVALRHVLDLLRRDG